MSATLVASPAQASPSVSFQWRGRPGLALHATAGIVKAIDSTSLVITRRGRRGDMSFVLTPATSREGAIAVGGIVSVRYREQGGMRVATAVALRTPRESSQLHDGDSKGREELAVRQGFEF